MLHVITLNGLWGGGRGKNGNWMGKKVPFFFFFFIQCLGWWKCQQTLLPKPLPVGQAFPGSQDLVLWCGAFPLLHSYKEWWERLSSCGLFLQGKEYSVIKWERKEHIFYLVLGKKMRCERSDYISLEIVFRRVCWLKFGFHACKCIFDCCNFCRIK